MTFLAPLRRPGVILTYWPHQHNIHNPDHFLVPDWMGFDWSMENDWWKLKWNAARFKWNIMIILDKQIARGSWTLVRCPLHLKDLERRYPDIHIQDTRLGTYAFFPNSYLVVIVWWKTLSDSRSRLVELSSLSVVSKLLVSSMKRIAVTRSNRVIHFRRSPCWPPTSNTLKFTSCPPYGAVNLVSVIEVVITRHRSTSCSDGM